MITGLLLICTLGTKPDCWVNSSVKFYDTIPACEQRLKAVKKEAEDDETIGYRIVDYRCVGWGEGA